MTQETSSPAGRVIAVLVALVVLIGVPGLIYVNSDGYRAGVRLGEAAAAEKGEDWAAAAEIYAEVAAGPAMQKEANDALAQLIGETLPSAPLAASAPILADLLGETPAHEGHDHGKASVPAETFTVWLDVLEKRGEGEPGPALAILDVIAAKVDAVRVPPLQERLLEAHVAEEPANVDALGRLAVILERRGDLERCRALLEPHRASLGTTEGARVLGQLFARSGELEAADALLVPYVKARLAAFRLAQDGFDAISETAFQLYAKVINDNLAPQSLYDRSNAVSDAEAQQLFRAWIFEQMGTDAEVNVAAARRDEAGAVVPVALDLGIVKLRRSQGLAEPDARRRELEAAEEVFLAIQSAVGETDVYRLFLGQVSFWLGKEERGRALFDELLTSNARSSESLHHVASAMREVGLEGDARTLAEEAYGKATTDPERHAAAGLRSVLATDAEDRLAWLEKGDTSDPMTRASLASGRAYLAMEAGDLEGAAKGFAEAVAIYESLPEDATTLNNAAVANVSLFHATGETDRFRRATELLERAVQIAPSDPILLQNLAIDLLGRTVIDLVGDRIDLGILRSSPDLGLLRHLYVDAASRAKLIEEVRANADFIAARKALERVLVLSPKGTRPIGLLAQMAAFTRDEALSAEVLRRVEENRPDLSAEIDGARRYFAGARDEEVTEVWTTRLPRLESDLARAREAGAPATIAIAIQDVVSTRLALSRHPSSEDDADPDGLVTLAEESLAASGGTAVARSLLMDALLHRAAGRLIGSSHTFTAVHRQARRSLSRSHMFALLFANERQTGSHEQMLEDADVQRSIELRAEEIARFPESADPLDWAFVVRGRPELAEEVAAAIAANTVGKSGRRISMALAPMSAAVAIELAIERQIAGDDAGSKKVLEDAKARGVPIPEGY